MDTTFIYVIGGLVIAAEWLYGLIGWACPILVDKR